MGLFNFIKNAGAKIFGSGKETKQETAKVDGDKGLKEKEENQKAARKLQDTVRDLKLQVDNLRVEIEGEKATIFGRAQNQSTREKVILVVGNVEGISQVDDRMDVENKEPEAVFHTVETGDTLSKIAKQHYGDANKYPEIFEANKPMLSHPDKIYPGQVLRIPAQKN